MTVLTEKEAERHIEMPTLDSNSVSPEAGVVFDITAKELRELNESKDVKRLKKLGGVEGLAQRLSTDVISGLSAHEAKSGFVEREKALGRNVFPAPPVKPFWKFYIETFEDKTMILLTIFAVIAIILGAVPIPGRSEQNGWIEGLAIILAVLIVSFVGSINNYTKELKFQALNSVKNDRTVKVIRGKTQGTVQISHVQVGDVVQLDTGDYIPADGIYIDGHGLAADESAMTGESDSVKKSANAPFLLSGCMVADGSGRMLVTAVGMYSEWGMVKSALATEESETPLQESLNAMVDSIGWVGVGAAVLTFIVLLIHFIVRQVQLGPAFQWANLIELVDIFIESLTLVVAVVPEGLPLAVTITLAYSMSSMLKDNNLVRHLAACETMGGATNICSDKTGTLTENRMTVVQMWACGEHIRDNLDDQLPRLDAELVKLLGTSISVNSSAFLKENKQNNTVEFVGNKTECAMLVLTKKLGLKYKKIRERENVVTVIPFSSERKRMSTVIKSRSEDHHGVVHVKGASEIVLGLCTKYIDNGRVSKMDGDKVKQLQTVIETMAADGLRTLAIAFRTLSSAEVSAVAAPDAAELEVLTSVSTASVAVKQSPTPRTPHGTKAEEQPLLPDEQLHSNLTLVALVGIEDPVRKEVPDAITTCKRAGIKVRMVTGDNKLTATKIAKECGIISSEDDLVLEGPHFRKLTDKELDAVLPRLAVLARSSPTDKYRLVMRLKALKEVVAVTGDGTNDGPALKAADVGLSMGIAGTEVAKEASDIIIMDDNFASIVKSVIWGRGVRKNIQKFLQFQLSINMVAVGLVFISACVGVVPPLRPLQLLWLNLIADSLAALALATERPEAEEVLKEKPAGRAERLITPIMWRNMFCYVAYQLVICLLVQYTAHLVLPINENVDVTRQSSIRFTMVFNIFVFFNVFNEINSHRVDNRLNIFKGFFNSYIFVIVIVMTAGCQAIIVEFGGTIFNVVPLTWWQWLFCIGIALTIMPFGLLLRLLVQPPTWRWLKYTNTIPWIDYNPRKRRRRQRAGDAEDWSSDSDEEGDFPLEESTYINKSGQGLSPTSSQSEFMIPSISREIANLASRGRTASSRGLSTIRGRSSAERPTSQPRVDLLEVHVDAIAANQADSAVQVDLGELAAAPTTDDDAVTTTEPTSPAPIVVRSYTDGNLADARPPRDSVEAARD